MHALEVLCNEPWCCILCWQFDMQFSYATHLAHPVLCRPTHLNISGYASDADAYCFDRGKQDTILISTLFILHTLYWLYTKGPTFGFQPLKMGNIQLSEYGTS